MSQTSHSLKQLALQKFKKNFWGVFSFYFIILVGLVSIFAYILAPDNSQYCQFIQKNRDLQSTCL
jgi:ABC-type antimicrobial peptide transport system permease subunit